HCDRRNRQAEAGANRRVVGLTSRVAAARGLPAERRLSHRDTATADLRLPAGGYALIDMRHARRHASVPTLLVMPAPSFMLATAAGQLFSNVLPWLLAILGLAIVGALVIML